MKIFLFIWFWLLTCCVFIPDLKADAGPSLEPEDSAVFQWTGLQGIDWHGQDWKIHLGGQLAADAVLYDNDNSKHSGFRWETINFNITGSYDEKYYFYVEPDLLGVDTKNNLYEAWVGWSIAPTLQVRIGQIKVALNTEFATRAENFPCLDYGFSSYLDSRYDAGLQIDELLLNRAFWYQASATAGVGFDLDGNRRSAPQLSFRAVVFPLRLFKLDFPHGLFVGLGAAWSPDYDDDIFIQTPLRTTVFTTPNLHGDYFKSMHYEVGWYKGPFRMGAERVRSEIEDVNIGGGNTAELDQLTTWSAYAAWCITGEQVRWSRGRWLPLLIDSGRENNFLNLPGCLEVAFRYSNADIDRTLFDTGLTTYDPSTQEVRTATLNLNWYPRPGLKIMAGWVKTIADHELSTLGDTNRDSSFVIRASIVL